MLQRATAPAPQDRSTAVALRFIGWTALVLALDLGTKHWAVASLMDEFVAIADVFALFLVFNTGAAGGVSLGPHTWLINVLGTAITVLLVAGVVAPLARFDRRAPLAMGLVAGGALGNLTSLVSETRGVPDFLALRLPEAWIVFNVADIGLWVGAGVLVPVTAGLVRFVRAERAQRGALTEAR
jgi:signal peptidase II